MQGFFGRDLPEDFGLQHAGEFLASNFGKSYKYIWGLGLLAAGQASTMSGTYTGVTMYNWYDNTHEVSHVNKLPTFISET